MNLTNLSTYEWEELMARRYGTWSSDDPSEEPNSEDTCLHIETHRVALFTSTVNVCNHCDEVIKND